MKEQTDSIGETFLVIKEPAIILLSIWLFFAFLVMFINNIDPGADIIFLTAQLKAVGKIFFGVVLFAFITWLPASSEQRQAEIRGEY